MTYHAMFSLYIMTGLLALVISVSLFCKSIAEAKEWKKKFGESESALRSYELGERSPKQDALERIAKALDVAPACFDTYGIEHYHELMHALFLLEDRFGIEPCADGNIRLTDETIQSCVCTWWSWKEFLKEGKITREEYENRKDSFLR